MRRWRRTLAIVRGLLPFVIAFVRDRRRFIFFGSGRRVTTDQHLRRARKLTDTIARLGPTFVKLAQVFSARADILPEPYLTEVGKLQDRMPPDDPAEIEAVIEAELGQPIATAFESFERAAVATASLGQVHRAVVNGQTVAVKVLRPRVEELVAIDLEISFRVLYLVNVFLPNHHVRALTNVVREFSVRVREEMDFRQEAEHIALFHRHFGEDTRVRAPEVLPEFTRRRVLVTQWIKGDKVDALAARFAAGELDFTTLMKTLTEIYLRMLLVEGFMHADPHPGNILVQDDGTIVFLDWGMVVQLNRSTRDSILRVALAAARDDLDGIISSMYELGMIDPEISRAEVRDAAAEILEIVQRMRELGVRRVQQMVQEIMDTFYTFPLMLPRELVYFFRATALLEGIGFRYDPAFLGLDIAVPVIKEMRADLLRATKREPQDIARGIIDDVRTQINALRDIVVRAEREEFRVRIHPRDMTHVERFMLLQVRRILLSIFALTIALIASITYGSVRNVWLLLAGIIIALVMFVVVLFLPTHLLENPMRHARRIKP
ncbi:MAG TPA: AarF/UbiB family protein [Longimicrobiales bacterium]|nr:AarF/UbiB family protein [Longimicrobiales bacterium]